MRMLKRISSRRSPTDGSGEAPAAHRAPAAPAIAPRRLVAVGALVLVALATAGCARQTVADKAYLANPDNHAQRHPILLTEGTETIDLPISAAQSTLSSDHASVVTAFAEEARSMGTSFVQLMLPKGSANEHAARATVPQIRQALARGGIWSGVVVQHYPAVDPTISAPIRLAYPRIKAEVPHDCGQWPYELGQNFNNTEYWNFGCATQANLAAMVDKPTDFVTPRGLGAGDAQRRLQILEKYRAGETTRTNHEFRKTGLTDVGK